MAWLPLLVVVGIGALSALVALVLAFLRKGLARITLLPAAVCGALLAPTAAVWVASHGLGGAFGALAAGDGGATGAIQAAILAATWPLLAGSAALLLTVGLFGLALLPLPFASGEAARPPASRRRMVFLGILALAAVALAGSLFEYTRETAEMTRVVTLVNGKTPEGKAALEKYPLLKLRGSAGIVAASARMSRGTVVGAWGAPYVLLVLLGLTAGATLVAWPVSGSRMSAVLGLLLVLLIVALSAFWMVRLGLEARTLLRPPPGPAAASSMAAGAGVTGA